jgi:catechol-2,3-dioxygenase
VTGMTSIDSITLEVADPTAAERFYATAFGLASPVRRRRARPGRRSQPDPVR